MNDRNAYQLTAQVRATRRQHYAQANAPQKPRVPHWIKVAAIVASIGIGGALTAPKAHAFTTHDSWTGHDKRLHLQAGGLIAAPISMLADSWMAGFVGGCSVGVLEEARDQYRGAGHVASFQDAAVTCLGAAIGAKLGVMVAPIPGGVFVGKSWSW